MIKPVKPFKFLVLAIIAATVFFPAAVFAQAAATAAPASGFGALLTLVGKYLPIVISLASASSATLPKATPGTWYAVLRGVIDLLAVNFGNAKNAP